MKRIWFWPLNLLFSLLFLASCAPDGFNAVPPGDSKPSQQSNVSIDSAEILLLESFPVQVQLHLEGNQPTPCHALEWEVSEPDAQGRIDVGIWAGIEPEALCIQVVKRFEARIPLGDYTQGAFSVWVNGEQVGSFNL
jgi:hypothetical protein